MRRRRGPPSGARPIRETSALIRYSVRCADLDRHHFVVECRVDAPAPVTELWLPSWIPGSYLLREFARHVVAIRATSDGREVAVEKISKSSWRCTDVGETLTVTLTVHAFDASVRGAYLDRRRAFFNGTHVFPAVAGREHDAVEVELVRPSDAPAAGWRVATALEAADVDADGFGRYTAADYDELVDHPVEISEHQSVDFDVAGVPHRFVVAGRAETDLERVAADLRQLCETQIDFFGRPPPFERYVFLGLAVGDGYGGLEHRASSSLVFARDDLPRPGEPGVPRNYQRFLGLASHEYFHSWHVKRTKPAAFTPYRLDRRNHTRLLWVFEGITSYYQELLLLRSDLVGVDAFLRRLGELATRVYRTPGRRVRSLAESSFDAWDVLYKPEPNTPNAAVSYYGKGALVALALDLKLRSETGVTLDDVMRELWRRYGAAGIGVPEDGFEALAVELGGAALEPFLDAAVRGTEDPPLEQLLERCGVAMRMRAATGPQDRGGVPAPSGDGEARPRVGFGATYRGRDGGLELVTVLDGEPAQAAGLAPGDVVVALDGLRVTQDNLEARLARLEPGTRVRVAYFRDDELCETELEPDAPVASTVYFELDPAADTAAVERRQAWLGA